MVRNIGEPPSVSWGKTPHGSDVVYMLGDSLWNRWRHLGSGGICGKMISGKSA